MSERPAPERQDDPPDVRTAVVATIRLLRDVHAAVDGDLQLRTGALRDALIRLHRHLQEEGENP